MNVFLTKIAKIGIFTLVEQNVIMRLERVKLQFENNRKDTSSRSYGKTTVIFFMQFIFYFSYNKRQANFISSLHVGFLSEMA